MPYGVYINGFRCSDLNEDGTEVQTNKIFVGGLSQGTSQEALKNYFAKYGVVVQCDVKKDRTTGYGFVHFDGPQSVENVCNGGMHRLQGRWMEVRKAVPAQQNKTQVSSVPARAPRSFSPAAGSRAMRESLLKGMASRGQKRRSRSRRRSPSSSSSSSSSPQPARKKRRRSPKRSARSCSSSSSSSSVQVTGGAEGAAAAAALAKEPAASNPDVDKAKASALQRLINLKSVEPKDLRLKQYRQLLREWHPDKNPERVEIATAVFQFLQKGKPMLESS